MKIPNHTPDGPESSDEPDLLAHLAGSLSDALSAVDAARAAIGTSLVWTRIAIDRRDSDDGDE